MPSSLSLRADGNCRGQEGKEQRPNESRESAGKKKRIAANFYFFRFSPLVFAIFPTTGEGAAAVIDDVSTKNNAIHIEKISIKEILHISLDMLKIAPLEMSWKYVVKSFAHKMVDIKICNTNVLERPLHKSF